MDLTPLRDGELLKVKLADYPEKVFSYGGLVVYIILGLQVHLENTHRRTFLLAQKLNKFSV